MSWINLFQLIMPIGFLMRFCVQFILTFSTNYPNMELLVILFLCKIYAHINISKINNIVIVVQIPFISVVLL